MCAKVLESVKGCRAFGVLIQREVRRSSLSCSQDWRSPSSGYVYRSRCWEIVSDPLDQEVHRERSGQHPVSSWYQSSRLITVQIVCCLAVSAICSGYHWVIRRHSVGEDRGSLRSCRGG